MHELSCPSCGGVAQFNLQNAIHICQICSTSFTLDVETGQKEVFGDHYIIPNSINAPDVKETVNEWLRRMHHRPEDADQEFVVLDIQGMSVPFWVTSVDAFTVWRGLVRRHGKNSLKDSPGSNFLVESGEFRRSYRWAVSGRGNLCENWGMTRLHEPKESIVVKWDGFPLDSTLSRGRMSPAVEKKNKDGEDASDVYGQREFFDYKYSNGMSIMSTQIDSEEALRRARRHIESYHSRLAELNVDHLVDIRTELEIAGVQLIHFPVWHATYQYRPRSALKHFCRPVVKNVLLEGNGKGIVKAELAVIHNDKVVVNSIVTAMLSMLFLLLGTMIHPAFYLISLFSLVVSGISAFLAVSGRKNTSTEDLNHGGISVLTGGSAEKDPEPVPSP